MKMNLSQIWKRRLNYLIYYLLNKAPYCVMTVSYTLNVYPPLNSHVTLYFIMIQKLDSLKAHCHYMMID